MSQQCKDSLVSVDNYQEDLGEMGFTTQLLGLSQVGDTQQFWRQKDRIIKRTGRLKRGTGESFEGILRGKVIQGLSTVTNK